AVDWPTNLAYGIAVFPASREVAILVAFWMMLIPWRPRWVRAMVGLATLIAGWWVIRQTCVDPWSRNAVGAWIGIVLAVTGAWVSARPARAVTEPDAMFGFGG